jgi:hypothetical protein
MLQHSSTYYPLAKDVPIRTNNDKKTRGHILLRVTIKFHHRVFHIELANNKQTKSNQKSKVDYPWWILIVKRNKMCEKNSVVEFDCGTQ